MGMVVQHNMNAINSYNKLNANVAGMKKSSEKLSSGYRINRAGDDAAGLAVSEKMRSQIKGLNQAIRNSQDGINMIQTFEGAAQETHSILQRMKELASQSANGTYDDPTDRAAIQLEFDQLNDELNQIADTDFNGTVVLNGGEMADGLKAVNGKFNYATAERDAKQLTANDVNKVDYQKFDDSGTIKTKANDVWKIISDDAWDRSSVTNNQGPDSVDVTLKYNKKDNTWSVESASNGANKAKLQAASVSNGGFTLKTTGAGALDIANVVLDATALKNGDTITLTLNNPAAGIAAPENGGAIVTDASGYTAGPLDADLKVNDANLTVTVNDIGEDKMTDSIKKIYDAFNNASVQVEYANKKTNTEAETIVTIGLSDGSAEFDIAGNLGATATAGSLKDGTEFGYKMNGSSIEIYDTKACDGNKLLTLTPATHAGTDAGAGTIKYNLGIEFKNYDTSKKPTVEISSTVDGKVSESNSFDNSKAIMTYADNITLQTGARTKDSVNFTFNYNTDKTADMGELKANLNLSARADGLNTENLSLATQADANKAIDQIDKAINKTSMVRASFGAIQNRLEHKITNLTTTSENLTEAESSIRDTDMASEMMNYTKFNILQQAAQSMLAQANQQPQSILQLLG